MTPMCYSENSDEVCVCAYGQVIKMLSTVVLLFALCWLPLQIYNLFAEIFVEINQ